MVTRANFRALHVAGADETGAVSLIAGKKYALGLGWVRFQCSIMDYRNCV